MKPEPPAEAAVTLDAVKSLASLLEDLPRSVWKPALAWCDANDVDDVKQIALAELDGSFVTSLPLKAGGAKDIIIRKRLSSMCTQPPPKKPRGY